MKQFLLCSLLPSCLTVCNLMDCSPPGSSVHGILQARILEWVAIFFSRGSCQPRDQTLILSWLLHCRWILYLLSHVCAVCIQYNDCSEFVLIFWLIWEQSRRLWTRVASHSVCSFVCFWCHQAIVFFSLPMLVSWGKLRQCIEVFLDRAVLQNEKKKKGKKHRHR